MIDDSDLYLDVLTLRRRGWTEPLIGRFLGEADQRQAVSHWANFTGKCTYLLERVEAIEVTADFEVAFQQSLRRRKIATEQIAAFLVQREETIGRIQTWRDQQTPDDLKWRATLQATASIFAEARGRGYRTPHKA